MSSITNPLTAGSPAFPDSSTSKTPPALDPLANEQTFLKLLVSQLKNQDPLNPTDGNQFVTQLTQYSQLEQLIGIRQNTGAAPAAETETTTTGN